VAKRLVNDRRRIDVDLWTNFEEPAPEAPAAPGWDELQAVEQRRDGRFLGWQKLGASTPGLEGGCKLRRFSCSGVVAGREGPPAGVLEGSQGGPHEISDGFGESAPVEANSSWCGTDSTTW
jgi:hypothetical protein